MIIKLVNSVKHGDWMLSQSNRNTRVTGNCYLGDVAIATRSLYHVRIAYPGQVSVQHMAQWASRDPHAYLPYNKGWVMGKKGI